MALFVLSLLVLLLPFIQQEQNQKHPKHHWIWYFLNFSGKADLFTPN